MTQLPPIPEPHTPLQDKDPPILLLNFMSLGLTYLGSSALVYFITTILSMHNLGPPFFLLIEGSVLVVGFASAFGIKHYRSRWLTRDNDTKKIQPIPSIVVTICACIIVTLSVIQGFIGWYVFSMPKAPPFGVYFAMMCGFTSLFDVFMWVAARRRKQSSKSK